MSAVSPGLDSLKNGPSAATRQRLRLLTWEGAFANIFITYTGGVYITGLALFLGAGDFEIGLLAALPFVAQLAQLGSAWVAERFHSRRTAVISLSAISRQAWWLLLPLLFIESHWRLPVLLILVAFSSVGVMAATPVWLAWMADIVPGRVRGRFFGLRSAVLAAVATIAVLAGGVILDLARSWQQERIGYFLLIAIACAAAAAALFVLRRVSDPAAKVREPGTGLSALLEPLRDHRFRRLLLVFFCWNAAIGISAPFFAPQMLTNLKMSFTMIAIYSTIASAAAVMLNKPWGRLIDRVGSRSVAAFCAFGIGLVPLIWLFPRPDFLWILGLEAAYSGALWTGFNLAAFNIPIANSPERNRSQYLAMFNVATGLAFFLTSILGGVLAESWHDFSLDIGPQHLVNYHLLFTISAVLRL
ncbi:MAG: MFS transporter, partial [bacterium]